MAQSYRVDFRLMGLAPASTGMKQLTQDARSLAASWDKATAAYKTFASTIQGGGSASGALGVTQVTGGGSSAAGGGGSSAGSAAGNLAKTASTTAGAIGGVADLSSALGGVAEGMVALDGILGLLDVATEGLLTPVLVLTVAFTGLIAVAAAVIGAFGQFVDVVRQAAGVLSEQSKITTGTGATSGQAAFLSSLGLSPGAISGMSAAFSSGASGNPMAQIARMQLGLGPALPRPFGDPNEGGQLAQGLSKLQEVFNKDPTRALTLARMAGLPEEILQKLNVSKDVQGARRADASTLAAVGGKDYETKANSLGAAFDRLSFNWNTLLVAFGRSAFEPITKGLLAVGDAIRKLAEWVAQNPMVAQALGQIVEWGLKAFAGMIGSIPGVIAGIARVYDAFREFIEGAYTLARTLAGALTFGASDKLLPQHLGLPAAPKFDFSPLKKPLDDIARNTADMAGFFKPGTYGGGARAQGAIPSALNGLMMDQALAGNTLRLGAFTI